jgi:peptidyl-prolyl cis-trans isomerase A (cyclophilin A)
MTLFSPSPKLSHTSLLAVLAFSATLGTSCRRDAAPEPSGVTGSAADESPAMSAIASAVQSSAQKPPRPKPAGPRLNPPDDPTHGEFTLAQATEGMTGSGKLLATIDTDLGTLDCELYDDKAPITVANFVGLARGTRPWKKGSEWVKTPLYEGTVFHRVAKGFMVQGGDPDGNGTGGPGYMIKNEIIPGAIHERGILSMARRGDHVDTAGSQFFVMDGRSPHLDGGYAIFGKCTPDAVVEKLASVEVRGDQSVHPTKIKGIKIRREKP